MLKSRAMKPVLPSLFVGAVLVFTLTGCCCLCKSGGSHQADLFNGKNLDGWNYVLADPQVARDAVWTVHDGLIDCKGEPLGMLYTTEKFTNFRLVVEYRWPPGVKPTNSGLFTRINGPAQAVPRCLEAQLQHGNAGDVLGLQGMTLASQPRTFEVKKHPLAGDIAGVKKLVDTEKPAGEWNRVEVLAQGANYTVWVNGQKVNEVSGAEVTSGPIGLQSEGGPIHFRKATITRLD
jgi:hypothetical protein